MHNHSILIALLLTLTPLTACGVLSAERNVPVTKAAVKIPPARAIPENSDAGEAAIRFLENRVKGDPDDIVAHNRLGGYYLQRLRETGNVTWLELATRTAQASLRAVPAEQNPGGLALLAQTEFAAHNFNAARDAATQLLSIRHWQDANRSFPHQMLGDALLELGDYDGAEEAYRQMKKSGSGVAVITRLAHLAWLKGKPNEAQQLYGEALSLATEQVPPARETVAWCRWQLGELAFATGDYETAEKHYADALITFPNYFRALAGLGRARAARGDLTGGIEQYEQAVRIIPEPVFVAALGDLYAQAGRARESAAQYALVEQTAKLSAASGVLYNRQLALFYADHDLNPQQAYEQAAKEYEARRDIYGADALAWTALKAGRVSEAQNSITEALRLGTQDARLFYHAGVIARAAGDRQAARNYLQRALNISPQFDPLQSSFARKLLAE
ncbi:MAG TPA: tetratricopeptide repeat protein [Blastocatellia bacterium]|nr:tetratricopeptide repeat protein [Blastocatellia bacterium]